MRGMGREKENEDLLMRVETSVWERKKANLQQNGEGCSQAAEEEGEGEGVGSRGEDQYPQIGIHHIDKKSPQKALVKGVGIGWGIETGEIPTQMELECGVSENEKDRLGEALALIDIPVHNGGGKISSG